ncbi:FAT domain-containing protein [Amylostereum chailletii]|nr:FAT domain-containing protein [Amylostereum chailletii]
MDNVPQLGTAADIEMCAARVADPAFDLRTRHAVACELRELIDTVRDSEAGRVFPHMIPVVLELLRSTDAAFHKDALEYQFRRVLVEVIHRVSLSDGSRPQHQALVQGMIHILRHDNEENGVTACKTILDLLRIVRSNAEELSVEILSIFQAMYHNIKTMVSDVLSEESPALDSSQVPHSMRSFKVLSEMTMVVVTFYQMQRHSLSPSIQTLIPLFFDILSVESPAQKKAREDIEAMGGIWFGMSSTIRNFQAYNDYITAQVKMVSCLTWIIRNTGEQYETHGDTLMLVLLRILQDIPVNGLTPRRELMVVFRHLMGTQYRRSLLPYLDKLFDENVLLGAGVASRESMRANAFAAVADMVHHIKNELTSRQLIHLLHVFTQLFHNHYLPNSVYLLSGKLLYGLVEVIVVKEAPSEAVKLVTTLLETSADRLEAMIVVLDEMTERISRGKKGQEDLGDFHLVEKARPIATSLYAIEKPEEWISETRFLYRTFIHGFRVCFTSLKKLEAPVSDGNLVSRIFDGCIHGMNLYEPESREAIEIMDALALAFLEIEPHVFQEVWTRRISFFLEAAQKRQCLLQFCQTLLTREASSPTMVSIVLRYLIGRLPLLGDYDDATAVVTIRMFKITFSAVTMHPQLNELILASHLSKLISDCFPLAARSSRPSNYYHLLRGLFRAIGGGGGRFELLYKEVLPLLPEMLEYLNRQLLVSEGYSRDMIVELCLTVPLRLTHLIPHLSYLMKPLALALRGTPELITQGLRTLELCIDNLTPDFLDPTLSTVLRELTEALQNLLKPVPANHHHAHTALRILGKLGGRNRRLLDREPDLKFQFLSQPAKVVISLGGTYEGLELGPMSILAARILAKPSSPAVYHGHAFSYLENCVNLLLDSGVLGRNREDVFVRALDGIFDATRISDLRHKAETFLCRTSRRIFELEIRRIQTPDSEHRYPVPAFSSFLDSIAHGLSKDTSEGWTETVALVQTMIQDFLSQASSGGDFPQEMMPILHSLAARFSSLSQEETWIPKRAGCTGLRIILDIPKFGVQWVEEREADLIRTLLHVLKDMPNESQQNVDQVIDVMVRVLRLGHSSPHIAALTAQQIISRDKTLISIFYPEVSGSSATVRQAAEMCLGLLSKLTKVSVTDLLMPHRTRVLAAIYTKPLRTLSFPMQIGVIEAMRYFVGLDPPLPELNEALLRLLHEALAVTDADDAALLGRANVRQGSIDITKLRVACIRLLTASMPIVDFFSKQTSTRQKVTSVYFKSLYSPHMEVKEAAHAGLRTVLTHQSRLPKELLQTGLRPILMNLADPKRLSVSGLEGLARLLELLTSYFKVEIGHKLLDHFRFVADPQMLQSSSKLLLEDNEGVQKLVRLTNIFHLLPSAANIFLDNLVNAIVQTEAQMHFSGPSPFTEPLAKYLNRYSGEAGDFFMKNLHLPRHVRTLRSLLESRHSPSLQWEMMSRTSQIISQCLRSHNPGLLMSALHLFNDFAQMEPSWLLDHPFVVDALVDIWRAETPPSHDDIAAASTVVKRHQLLLSLFQRVLELLPRVDIPFEYQRSLLYRFLSWFSDPSWSLAHKTYFVRIVITPMIMYRAKSPQRNALLDEALIGQIHRRIWQPMMDGKTFADADDTFNIELLHLTTVIVQSYPHLLEVARKDIIKCAWHYITSDDSVVKQVAYLLAATFFAAFETPQKFILRAWTGLLRPPHQEGRVLTRQALDILAPALPRSSAHEPGHPLWAKTTRRLLAEESHGNSQLVTIYQLVVRQSQLFYPVRGLFVPHMVNSLPKLGLHGSPSFEARLLSVDLLQTIFDWEQKATAEVMTGEQPNAGWITPLPFRETIVSYLVRLATMNIDLQYRNLIVPRALNLLRTIVGPNGWSDVTVKLNYFSRVLEQTEMTNEATIATALSTAKVLQVVAADKPDSWFADADNAISLQRLIRKGLVSEDAALNEALHPVFDRLIHLFPLPKEDDEQKGDMTDFHTFVYSAVEDGLQNATAPRGTLLMLKSVVDVTPERIEYFSNSLMKLMGKLTKEHVSAQTTQGTFETTVRYLTCILDICQASSSFLGEQRRSFSIGLSTLVERSKSSVLCKYMLEIGREWAFQREPYPQMNQKAAFLQKMSTFENRGEVLFNAYLELVYQIYTDPTLRRSDLTSRLEQSFLLGCRARDPSLRDRFVDLLDSSVPRSLSARLSYILGVQSWEPLAEHYWIPLALHLLLGAIDPETPQATERKASLSMFASSTISAPRRLGDILRPMQRLLFLDPNVAHETWVSIFPAAWSSLSRREQADITHQMVSLLSKDYHIRQSEKRPNVVQTLLTSINVCSPTVTLPPHLIKYLSKTFGAWHAGLEILQSMNRTLEDDPAVRDTVPDALSELYAELSEDDLFYGVWRRRCLHIETNMGIAFEQNGMWEQAATVYEHAQTASRAGTLPYSEPEYCLWEDHWILAAEKLQQWDVLYEFARPEGNQELMLESAWRIKNWAESSDLLEEQIHALPDVPTPRRRVFEAFIALLKAPHSQEKNGEFTKILEDAHQLALRKWIALPSHLSLAHIPLLQHFQQFVELQEAVQIFSSLSNTNATNLEKSSADLKMILQAWRERLPNLHDDISIWSDLVSWRQNVFHAINKAYVPLINNQSSGTATASNSNTAGYRGYHETAWIINRFAHVARKHDLLDVCFTLLNKIYTLPNIEISEAFLKLREQARCHYQKPNDLQAGLDVINNTNLLYFSQVQKAEFYTLKGMFHARLGNNEEASEAFGQAIQTDMTQAKGWDEWGRWYDRMFKESPADLNLAGNAVNCYLCAAGLYKNAKSRPCLTRVLWLLSLDDNSYTIARAFDTYKGDAAFWYWITLIPQLCISVSHREIKQARYILLNLAKLYPQALFFPLRTTREEFVTNRKQQAAPSASRQTMVDGPGDTPRAPDIVHPQGISISINGSPMKQDSVQGDDHMVANNTQTATTSGQQASATDAPVNQPQRHPTDYVEEILQILKTAFPLLVLNMEQVVEQIFSRFKANQEEEVYRLICMCLQDAMQQFALRTNSHADDGRINSVSQSNIARVALGLVGQIRKEYDDDFIKNGPTMHSEYIRKLQLWRDKYERHLDSRPRTQPLDLLSHWLTQFQYGKFDDIEIPGQYTEDKDNNQNFVRIVKFGPKFENCRSNGLCWRRFSMHGSDNSVVSFAVQLPASRHARREEKVIQLYRTLSSVLQRKKECRKRNLIFHLPASVLCGTSLRLLQSDSSYVNFGDIFEQFCESSSIAREDPVLIPGEKIKMILREFQQEHGRMPTQVEYFVLKKDILEDIMAHMVPETVLSQYMFRTMSTPSDLWRMRKQFTLQIASTSFMTYILSITSRVPARFNLSRRTGMISMSDLFPGFHKQTAVFSNNDVVPFRFTPNIQHFIGPIHTEGLMTSALFAMGRSLSAPEYDLEQQLALFSRDEVTTWLHGRNRPFNFDPTFRQLVQQNISSVVQRVETMSCKLEREQALASPTSVPSPTKVPVVQTIVNLISTATDPINIMKMTEIYSPWF